MVATQAIAAINSKASCSRVVIFGSFGDVARIQIRCSPRKPSGARVGAHARQLRFVPRGTNQREYGTRVKLPPARSTHGNETASKCSFRAARGRRCAAVLKRMEGPNDGDRLRNDSRKTRRADCKPMVWQL